MYDCSLRGSVSWNLKYVSLECSAKNRSLYGSVSWNRQSLSLQVEVIRLFPTWERELKRAASYPAKNYAILLPTWERELKHRDVSSYYDSKLNCSLHGSVNWNPVCSNALLQQYTIAPCMGVWVEIIK